MILGCQEKLNYEKTKKKEEEEEEEEERKEEEEKRRREGRKHLFNGTGEQPRQSEFEGLKFLRKGKHIEVSSTCEVTLLLCDNCQFALWGMEAKQKAVI